MDKDIPDDVAALENAVEALRVALVEGDREALNKMLHDRLTYSHGDGQVWTKDMSLEKIGGKKRYASIALSEQTVDIIGSVGIVRHLYEVVNNLDDGRTSKGRIKVLLCWIKPENDWQLLARGSTPIPA